MIDFERITRETFQYNFHSHTQFCDGHAPMNEFVRSAIASDFNYFGFSPHSPIPFQSSCNMAQEQVGEYLTEIERLRQNAGDKLVIYTGMEVDYLGDWNAANDYFKQLPLDFKIGSLHFLPISENEKEFIDIDGSPERFITNMHTHFSDDIDTVIRTFYARSLNMLETGGFEIVGHLDKIGYNASQYAPGIDEQKWYDALVVRTIEAIKDLGYIAEINTKAWEKSKRFFPKEKYFTLLKRWQVPVVFNSDSHYPDLINAGRDEARRLFVKA